VHRFEELGLEGLKDKPKSGRKPGLTEEQLNELSNVLQNNGPDEFGYNTATWNDPILKEYIEKRYYVAYKKAQVYNLLKKLGFTYQKGRAKYPEADEQKKEEFKTA
jgi:transposase